MTLKATVRINAFGRRMTTVRIVIALVYIETATVTCLIAWLAFAVVPARQIHAIGRCVAGMQTGSTFVQIFLASSTNITIPTGAYARRQAQPAVQTWLLTNSCKIEKKNYSYMFYNNNIVNNFTNYPTEFTPKISIYLRLQCVPFPVYPFLQLQ